MTKMDAAFKAQLETAQTTLKLGLYFLRTILEDRKKGLFFVFFDEEMWNAAERSPMAAFLRKYQSAATSPGPPPGRDTWSDLVVKRLGEEFIPLWRTREPDEESYALVSKAIEIIRKLLKILRNPEKADARTISIIAKLADRASAREALRDIVTKG
jgi:hypothetical protein